MLRPSWLNRALILTLFAGLAITTGGCVEVDSNGQPLSRSASEPVRPAWHVTWQMPDGTIRSLDVNNFQMSEGFVVFIHPETQKGTYVSGIVHVERN